MGGQDFSGWHYFGLVVRVRTEDAVKGVSEVFVTPGWYGPDTTGSCHYLIEHVYGPAMIGECPFETTKLLQKMDRLWMHNLWSKAVLELALFDTAAKTIKRPLVDLMGGQVRPISPSFAADVRERTLRRIVSHAPVESVRFSSNMDAFSGRIFDNSPV